MSAPSQNRFQHGKLLFYADMAKSLNRDDAGKAVKVS